MIIAGVVAGTSASGKQLSDGAAALVIDGELVYAIAEERLARQKAASGWRLSLAYCLRAAGLTYDDIDAVGFSTCCDAITEANDELVQLGAALRRAQVIRVSHHESHAWYAYLASPFDRCLISVADAGGNVIGDPAESWWTSSREQLSWFLASPTGLQLVDRDFDGPYDAGLGECFRAVTFFLGWPSGRFASKTMALAAYGSGEHLSLPPAFEVAAGDGHIKSTFRNDPLHPVEMCLEVLNASHCSMPPRFSGDVIRRSHCDFAAWIQNSLTHTLTERSLALMGRTSSECLVLAGGVALNCQSNRALCEAIGPQNVFVPAAPGDTGQAIGNALRAFREVSTDASVDRASVRRPFLGLDIGMPSTAELRRDGYRVWDLGSQSPKRICELLDKGLSVGTIRGSSEFGPRALGNRSILADARIPNSMWALNRSKGREPFMPFAASVLQERLSDYFPGASPSPYMQFAWECDPKMIIEIPAALHADGSCRLHTVSGSRDDQWMRTLLTTASETLGVPMVINTSLNGPGSPIVESVSEALVLLDEGVIDALVVEDRLVQVPDR